MFLTFRLDVLKLYDKRNAKTKLLKSMCNIYMIIKTTDFDHNYLKNCGFFVFKESGPTIICEFHKSRVDYINSVHEIWVQEQEYKPKEGRAYLCS